MRHPVGSHGRSGRISLAVVTAILLGACAGVGLFTFVYAEGATYLVDDAAACGNCHVMRSHVDAWVKSSHRAMATCNDCHAPHEPVGKLLTKARNGFFHSLAFTTDIFPDNLHITEANRRVTESACRSCHGAITERVDAVHSADGDGSRIECIRCHADVGHDT